MGEAALDIGEVAEQEGGVSILYLAEVSDYERSINQGNDNNTYRPGYFLCVNDHLDLYLFKAVTMKKTIIAKILRFLFEAIINQLIIQKQEANEKSIQQRQGDETKQ